MLPIKDSSIECIGKSVYHKEQAVRSGITTCELLRLFDMPLVLDPVVQPKRYSLSRGPAPFESSPIPNVGAFILRSI